MESQEQPKIFQENMSVVSSSLTSIIFDDFKNFLTWWFITIPGRLIAWEWRFLLIVEDFLSWSGLGRSFFIPLFNRDSKLYAILGILIRIILLPIETLILLTIFILELLIFTLWLSSPFIILYFLILTPII